MNSQTTSTFWKLYYQLPFEIRRQAVEAYWLWQTNPESPGLHFKRVGKRRNVWSIRITDNYRALGLREGNTVTWFWIGNHDEYMRLIKQMAA